MITVLLQAVLGPVGNDEVWGGVDRRDAVPVIRRRDAHGVNVRACQQPAEILVALTIFVLVFVVDLVDGLLKVP